MVQSDCRTGLTKSSDDRIFNKDCVQDTLWETIKGTIRYETIKYAALRIKKIAVRKTNLLGEIKKNRKINSSILHLKAKHIYPNEKKQHTLQTQKKKSAKKSIQTLIVNNKEINDKDDILQAEVEYV